MAENETLLDHVADIVTAHVSNNSVSPNDLPGLIRSVHTALVGLGQAPAPVEEERKPAVSVRASVRPDAIACLECGAKLKVLKRHLGSDHGLTPSEYRARWKLAADYPMVAPDYAARRKELALSIGLGRKPKVEATPVVEAPAATKPAANRKAAPAKAAAPAATEEQTAKPKSAPRKKLKVAFGGDAAAAADAAEG